MMVFFCCGVFGLIGFSGKEGCEVENFVFMVVFVDYYKDDWWFESEFVFVFCEVG